MEIWKPLIYGDLDLSNRYEVSNTGKMRNIKTKHELKQETLPKGYRALCISLGSRSKKKLIKVHKAVAYMFVDGYQDGLVVNHKDLDKSNNNADNLEWITQEENYNHANSSVKQWRTKRRKIRCKETGEIFDSIHEAMMWCGIKTSHGIILSAKKKQAHSGRHPLTSEKLSWEYV